MTGEERADPELELSPIEYVIDYLTRAFPTRQMETYTASGWCMTKTAASLPLPTQYQITIMTMSWRSCSVDRWP